MSFLQDDSDWTPEKEYRCLWRLRRKLSRILITPVLKNKFEEEAELAMKGIDEKEEDRLDGATLTT